MRLSSFAPLIILLAVSSVASGQWQVTSEDSGRSSLRLPLATNHWPLERSEAERPPTARIVPLPDAYAPDLAPGEVLVPGSVRDVVVYRRAVQSSEVRSEAQVVAPAPRAITPGWNYSVPGATYSVPAPSYSVPYSSCYSSSYQGSASYQYQGASPQYVIPSSPVIPSYRSPVYSMPEVLEPAYAPRRRRFGGPRVAGRFGWGLERESYARTRLGFGLGAGDGARGWGRGFEPFAGGVLSRQ